MKMVFTDFKDSLCRLVFLHEGVSLPTGFQLGFSKTTPTKDGMNITEPSSECGYTRMDLTRLTVIGDGMAGNAMDIEYPTATASWGKLTWCVLFDQNGKPLFAQKLEAPIFVEAGKTVVLKAGDAKLWFGDGMVIV